MCVSGASAEICVLIVFPTGEATVVAAQGVREPRGCHSSELNKQKDSSWLLSGRIGLSTVLVPYKHFF